MPSTVEKTRKQIARKRRGEVNALHTKSRDSMRLHKAGVRDERLQKLAAARNKKEQPIVERAALFQSSLKQGDTSPLTVAAVQERIEALIEEHREEYALEKKARRPGRPPSTKEDLLKMRLSSLELEYDNGFVLPDVLKPENAKLLHDWDGSWIKLTTLSWIRVSSNGHLRPADFPSKGIS